MIVVHKRSGRLRISRNVDSKYEDVARSLRRLQIQPVGENIASVELNNGVIGIAEYSKHFPIRIERDGTIRSVDKEGRSKGEISLGVYHVKNADGEWRTLPKHQDIKKLVKEYGGDDYQEVY